MKNDHLQKPAASEKSERLPLSYAVLFSVIILGMYIRVHNVGYRPFWLDELYSVSYAQLTIESLFKVLHTDIQMPLYFILLHAWIWIFGDSDRAVRSLSILFGLLGIIGFFLLLRKGLRWGVNSCLIGLSLLAVNPFHIYYSIEARTYSLMFALATFYLTAFALMHAEGDKKYCLAYALLQALLLYTHPTALLYCFCINATYVFLLFSHRECSWLKLRNFLAANVVAAVIFAPWVTSSIQQAYSVHKSFWAQLPSPVGALKSWLSIALFWSPELVEFLSYHNTGMRVIAWICIIVPVLLLMARGGMYALRRKNLVELLIILSLFVYPAALYLVSLLFKPIFMNKILIPSLIGLLVLIVIPEEKHFPGKGRATPLLVSLFLLISISLSFAVTTIDKNPDWKKIGEAISQRAGPGDLVLVYRSHGASLLKRYSKGNFNIEGVTHDFEDEMRQRELQNFNSATFYRPFSSQAVRERLVQLIDGRERFFVVLFPVPGNEVVMARDFTLKRYAVNELIMLKQAQILVLSSSPQQSP